MDKKVLKISVLVIIGLFVFSMAAIPLLQGLREGNNSQEPVPSSEVSLIQGTTNVTVSSYSSSITVSGNISELKDIKEQFKENDWLDSETYISNTETIFNLKNSEYTKNVSDILIENGYSVSTNVNLKFPDELGEFETDELYQTIKTSPVYSIGDTIVVEFAAYVQHGKVIQLAGFELAPQLVDITLDAVVTDIKTTKFTLSLEDVEKQQIIENKYNISFVDSKVVFEVNNPNEEYEYISNEFESYDLKISQTLGVELQASKQEGVYTPMDFIVQSSSLHEINDTLSVRLDAVLDKGEITNIFEYEIIE